MSKTWRQVRSETINLGFEKIKSYDKNPSSYIEAFNWAQKYIASTVGALTEKITLEKSDSGEEIFDLKEIASYMGYSFSHLSAVGVLDAQNRRLENTALINGRFLSLPEDFEGEFVVYIDVLPKDIDTKTADNFEVLLPDKWANLMPYLMANRLFLDDDAQLAGYYWNLFNDMKNDVLSREYTQTVTVNTPEADEGWWE